MIEIPRFYKKEKPEIDEYIFCTVNQIDENCIYFHLVEYNLDILVPFKDLNECRGKKAKFKIAKKYKLNTSHLFYVTENKGNIEISNRGLEEDKIKEVNESFNKKKIVINIFKDFLNNLQINDRDLYIEYAEKTIWKLDEEDWYDRIIDFKFNNKEINMFDIDDKEKEIFIKYINHSINDIKYNLCIEMQIISTHVKGINLIKETIEKIDKIDKDLKKNIRLINAPLYSINIENTDLNELKKYTEKFKHLENELKGNQNMMFSCEKKEISNNLNKNILKFD